jgi:hypothetical protein
VQFSKDNTEFWLTEAGYRQAEQNWLQRVISYLNKNPGISIPISVLSLFVAAAALLAKCSHGGT